MKQALKVGCCGYGIGQSAYFEQFSCVEVQQTFYQPPMLKTLQKWRSTAPSDFEFTLKAWQLITHEATSPTYRRLKRELSAKETADAGAFKPTPIVKEATEISIACAEALNAKGLLFQCPASFDPTQNHIENLRRFFTEISRPEGMHFYWEPRGAWGAQTVHSLCKELNIFPASDPFVIGFQSGKDIYYRLHGKTGWRYTYSEEELKRLADSLSNLPKKRERVYVFFNNVSMVDDAKRFEQLIAQAKLA